MAITPGEQKNNFSFDDPQKQRQRNLIYIFGALILTTGAVLYFGFLKGEEVIPNTSLIGNEDYSIQEQMINSLEKVNLNKTIIDDVKFNSLSLPVKLPLTIDPSEKGRNNPFDNF